ncbi:hypothetical protein L218DRAFT_999269 [Marasmius fiardii PR-910]|nr:hypothetical protein L218DRAFT_999269 [Marasmius fiardii PR-910]
MLQSDPVKKSDKGNIKVKAWFGRQRTHNEQLIVCTCGMIAAHATMFGAEAISSVKDFIFFIHYGRHSLGILGLPHPLKSFLEQEKSLSF